MLLNLASSSSSSSSSSSATKMTTTTTTKALTCDLLVLSSVVDNNNNNSSSKIDSRRIRARRRRKGGENGDLNANGLIGLLALCCCLCFCCLISASSGFVIPAPKSSSSASSSHLFEADVNRHGPLPTIQRLNHSETVPNNNSSNKSSPVGSLSADSSTRQRPKRHILPAQQQQQPNHHHHHQSSSSSSTSESSLPINVRNGGGEVFRQVISANTDADYIRLEFTDTDGSLVRTLVDFRNNLQIFRLVRLGEQDLNERRWTTYCFITVLPPDEYISADAMSKLTQKNPATIRQAELDHGSALYNMDLKLKDEGDDPEGSKLSSSNYDFHLLSPHLRNFCEHAQGRVYASEEDLLRWKTNENGSPGGSAAVRSFANVSSLFSRLNSPLTAQNSSASSSAAALSVPEFRQCGELLAKLYQNFSSSSWQNSSSSSSSLPLGRSSDEALARHFLAAHQGELCHCSLSLVLPFYPCSVRHCTAPDPANPGKVVNYRCGIRTCRRRYEFRFAVADKLACLADFDPTVKLSSADSADGSVDLQKEVVDEERMANNPQEADGNGKDTGDGEADPPLADNSVAANSKQV